MHLPPLVEGFFFFLFFCYLLNMNIVFVCHGNICRSPIAEYVFKYLARKDGSDALYSISSAGVSSEEEGNDIYPPAKQVLRRHAVPFSQHHAHRITDKEFHDADIVIALDSSNLRALRRRFGDDGRIRMLLGRDVADPWYTDDFDTAFSDIESGCISLLMDTKASFPDILS